LEGKLLLEIYGTNLIFFSISKGREGEKKDPKINIVWMRVMQGH
jgi:hypothetical protein